MPRLVLLKPFVLNWAIDLIKIFSMNMQDETIVDHTSDNKLAHSTIREYKKSIEYLAKSKSEHIFDSFGPENAAIIISTIFKFSTKRVIIYANEMNGEISSDNRDYIDSLIEFLYEGKQLLILLDSGRYLDVNFESHNFRLLRVLNRFKYNNRIEIRQASSEFIKGMRDISTDGASAYHFTVGDNSMYRIEIDNVSHAGICSFNGQETAMPLIETFMTYFYSCKKIEF